MIRTLFLLSALWAGATQAIITWQGSGCLYRAPAGEQARLIACDVRDVGHRIILGQGLTDAAYRPAAGDVYVLARFDGSIEKDVLHSTSYLAVWRN